MEDSGGSTDRQVSKHFFENLMDYVLKDKFDLFVETMKKLSLEDRKATCRLTNNRGCTLLFNATRFHVETHFVKFLLEECGADTEQRGDHSTMEQERFEQVTPLWVAAYQSKLEVAKTLLQHGADINAVNLKTEATPVLSACLRGYRDIVEFLIEKGADINQPDNRGNTCLMSSVCHVEICGFLIQQGVSINAVDNYGDSALHHAIKKQCGGSIRLLLRHGADASIYNKDGDDALHTAALYCFPETGVVELLIQELKPPPQISADMYSLQGAVIMGKYSNMQLALHCWKESAILRTDSGGTSGPSVGANALYNFAVEAKDIDTLINLSQDADAMTNQALVVLERIIGPDHPITVSVLSRLALYRQSIEMCKYALRNMRLDRAHISNDCLASFRHICDFVVIPSVHMFDFLECLVEKISNIMSSLPYLPARLAILPAVAIHLVNLCWLRSGEDEKSSVLQLVSSLLQCKPLTEDGQTLLHLAVTKYLTFTIDDFLLSFYFFQTRLSVVVDCLLTAGAAVNAVYSEGNTPLHIAAFNRPLLESLAEDWVKVIQLLLRHGAHVDIANSKRQVAYDKLPDIDIFPYVSLKCLAARVIRAKEILYHGILPKTLADFVDCH